jgi:cell filamentation protein
MGKISIRFFDDREVRAVWDETNSRWMFSVLDIVSVLADQSNYNKARNYWKYLKSKLKKNGNELGSVTTQLKLEAPDGKSRMSNVLDYNQVIELAKQFPSKKANRFIDWFTFSDESIDGKSKSKAYALFGSSIIDSIGIGTVKGLQQIHGYIFGGLYDFAGQIRQKNIAKGGFQFAMAQYLDHTLSTIESMPDSTFEEIIDKYVEMNIAHPFMEGNGRSTRIWLDMLLKARIAKCIDWSKIDKNEYLSAMTESPTDSSRIKSLIQAALTDKIDDREVFMKGIDYSYYYEEN